jgi:hypothetical protein
MSNTTGHIASVSGSANPTMTADYIDTSCGNATANVGFAGQSGTEAQTKGEHAIDWSNVGQQAGEPVTSTIGGVNANN